MGIKREWQRGEYLISTDKTRIDLNIVHSFLTQSYWAEGISRELVCKSIENSLAFGMYKNKEQVGFARVITDLATFAYIADVFIVEDHRKRGLAKWLMEVIVSCPELQGFRRWLLATRDAHGLYRKVGFTALNAPERWMQIHTPGIYRKKQA
jgi:GNAT superfamily N-acetyltransferase